ncbi:hypothetical protein HU200_044606 [Digitaria exilis]|uniref:protein-serine/threonine phosphatase n=1 Tax=Digitaria exilis TaxID=1010633 RepID=A0A835EF68_9POAL|nr:hypothetical protein HU200_044606 [Digitaria exilis]
MGASQSSDIETTTTEEGENVRIKYAVASIQGFGGKVEDAYAVVLDLHHATSFFGLYDGHGGSEVASFCARSFHTELQVHQEYQSDLNKAIRSVFSRMDELLQQSDEWRELVNPTGDSSTWIQRLITTTCLIVNPWYLKQEATYVPPRSAGSTACVAITRGNHVIVANVGDSHCVASRNGQAIQLSTDHSLDNEDEIKRLERAGVKISMGNAVIEDGRVVGYSVLRGILVTSRGIGDFVFKQNKNLTSEGQIMLCNPDIKTMEITNEIDFLVIASHGLWASMTYQGVVDFVREELESGETDLCVICERLVHHVLPSPFDTTAILIQFKHTDADNSEESESDDWASQEIKSATSDQQ